MKAGPGWECQPVEPPGSIVVVRTTVSVGLAEKILKPGEVSWYGPRLITPSVVGCAPEGGVADATPTSADDERSRKPRMMRMRFICVCLSAAVLDRRLRCEPRTSSVARMGLRTWRRASSGLFPAGEGADTGRRGGWCCGRRAPAWSVLDGERHVQHARGGEGEGE